MRVPSTSHGAARLTVLALACVTLLAACPADDAPDEVVVEMYDDYFEPEEVSVEPGQSVRFVNRGRVAHNAIALDGGWQTEPVIDPGEDEVITRDESGTYDFYCSFHSTSDGVGMAGRLTVGDVEAAPDVDDEDERVTEWTGVTRRVPEDHDTIQAAVDAADPGDLVLIGPGVYREQVEVTTPSLVIRGVDRDEVIVDAEHEREMGIIITADGVAVENLTVRDALVNGVYWRGVTGFRGSYLTAMNNVDYGIYAFDSTDGVFERSYASGSADGAYYVGQCRPCRIVLDEVVAEHSALGYSGTNAGGELYLVNSLWRLNGAGIVPNTLDSQRDPPARNPSIIGNVVRDNGNPDVPHLSGTWPAFGNGILLAGVRDAVVERNVVVDNANHGIIASSNIDDNYWFTGDNVVRDNVVRGSGRGDLTFAGPGAGGDCWEGNEVDRTVPWALQATQQCSGVRVPRLSVGPTFVLIGHLASRPEIDDLVARVAAQPEPGPQEQMPDGADAEVVPAHDAFAAHGLDPAAVELPDWDGQTSGEPVALVMGVPMFAGNAWEVGMGLLGVFVPTLLYLAWVVVALVDLARQVDRPVAGRGAWAAVVVVVPLLGVLAYYVVGGSRLDWTRRLGLVVGGLVVWIAALGAAIAGSGLL